MEPRPRHSHVCKWLIVALLALISLIPWSSGAKAADLEKGTPLQLEVIINGQKTGLLASFVRLPDGKMAARRAELVEVGIDIAKAAKADDLIALDDLLSYHFKYDEPTQSISFDLDDNQRVARTFNAMGISAPRAPVSADWGSVLNYTLFGSEATGLGYKQLAFNGGSATLDARAFSPYGTLSQTGILGSTTTRDLTTLRLETTFSYSDPETLVTYRVGDSISGGLNWTRPIRFGGIQAERNFGLRPDLITAPLPSFSGSAAVPSTLDVYVDNTKTYTQEVPPGPFQVNNLPVISGGDARLVLRDATGREVETNVPFYSSASLLREGMSFFSVETGFPRLGFGTDSNNYVSKEMASWSSRYGLYDWLTLEGHAEATAGLYNGGAGVVSRVGDFGVVSLAASGSSYHGQTGLQSYLSFETRFWNISFNASSIRTYFNYNDIASVTAPPTFNAVNASNILTTGTAAPAKAIDRFSLSFRLPDLSSLGLNFVHMQPASGPVSNLVSAAWSRPAYADSQLFVTAFVDTSNRSQYGVFAGISIPLGRSTSVSSGATSSRTGTSVTTDASRPLGAQTGDYGWRLRDSEGAMPYRSAEGAYRTSVATLQAGVEQSQGGVARGTAQVDGAIATMGGGVFASNRIDDSFAVVDTGTPGVPVFHENRLVGETNSQGQLLVPSLRAYGNNKLSIDPTGLPVNAEIETVEGVVAPSDRSGVLVKFATRTKTQSAVVVLVGQGGKPLPVGSRGRLKDGDGEFVVGYDGRAFVKGLKNANVVTVSVGNAECQASFDYAASDDNQVVIGPVSCVSSS